MEINKLRSTSKDLMFDLSEEVLAEFVTYFDNFLQSLDKLKTLATDGVAPLVRLNPPQVVDWSDAEVEVVENQLNVAQVLSNTYNQKDGNAIVIGGRQDYDD